MATYTVTTLNWNSGSFWASISESSTGHTLDFSDLGPAFQVMVDQLSGILSITDGVTTFTVGEAGVTGTDANFGGSTLLDYFTSIEGSQGQDFLAGSTDDDLLDGNSGDELLQGNEGNDTLFGNGGADKLYGGAGNDLGYGGVGNDLLVGWDGDDRLLGEGGDDSLYGDSGADSVYGGAGADLIYGGTGDDQLEGGWEDDANDSIYGDDGNDLFFGYGGNDLLVGGTGDDWIDGGAGDDNMQGGADNDRIVGDLGSDTITGGIGYDVLTGGEGADSIDGGDDADQIWGNAGDTIVGGEGGDDNDTLYVDARFVSSVNYTTAESGTVTFNDGTSLQFSEIEAVVQQNMDGVVDGTSGNDEIGQFYYDADGDWIDNGDAVGQGDGDSVRAGDGNDTIWAQDGNDTVHGEGGDDRISTGQGDNVAFGGAGRDTINAEFGNDTISGDDFTTTGPNLIVNGSFEDTTGMTATVYGFTSAGAAPGWTDDNGFAVEFHNDGRGGLNATDGTNWADLEANPGQNSSISQSVAGVADGQVYVLSFDAADLSDIDDGTTLDNQLQVIWNGDVVGTIDAVDGNWRSYEFHMIGGSGDGSNTLTFAGLGDASGIGASLDNVQMFEAVEAVAGDADVINGGDGDDDMMGGVGDDTIDAGGGADEVVAGSGNDSVLAGAGNDVVYGGTGQDTIVDGAGDDIVYGGDGNDVVYGGDGADTFSGNSGADEILGGDGNNDLQGGQGNDTLFGGNDSDIILGDGQWYTIEDYAAGGGASTNLTIINSADGPIELWWIDGTGTPQQYATIQAGDTFVQPTFEEHNWVLRDSDGYWLELIEGAPNQTVNYGAEGLNDSIDGGAGSDSILGQFGDDTILGGDGTDTIFGGSGNDSIDGGNRTDVIHGDAGDDLITDTGGSLSDDTIYGDDGNDTIAGGVREDLMDGGADADTFLIENAFGNDTIIGGEAVTSGVDFDTIDASGVTRNITLDLTAGNSADSESGTLQSGFATPPAGMHYVRVFAPDDPGSISSSGIYPDGAIDFTSGTWHYVLVSDGDTLLNDSQNNDADQVFAEDLDGLPTTGNGIGAPGQSTYTDANGNTFNVGWLTSATIAGSTGVPAFSYLFVSDAAGGEPVLSGTPTGSTSFNGSQMYSSFTAPEIEVSTFSEVEAIALGSGDDSILGSTGDDNVTIGAGADTVVGGTGSDTFALDTGTGTGDGENDTVVFSDGHGNDTVSGFEAPTDNGDGTFTGNDQLDVSGLTSDGGTTPVHAGDVVVTDTNGDGTGDAILTFPGGESITLVGILASEVDTADELVALGIPDARDFIVEGTAGADLINATYTGDPEGDLVDANDNATNTNDDYIVAGAGNDTAIGGDGADSIEGEAGNDLLIGDGSSSITGGGQFGLFVLESSGSTSILKNGTFTFDAAADSVNIEVNDDDSAFEDLVSGGGSPIDTGAPQILTSDITIGSTSYSAGTETHAIAQSDIVNETTGETGNAWLIQIGPVQAGNTYFAYDIAVNDGDQITWTSSNDIAVQDPIFANTTGLEYADLVLADAPSAGSNDTLVGGIGDDTLIGGGGDDSLIAGDGADSVSGGEGADVVDAGTGNDTVDAGSGDDTVYGWTGDDSLTGGDGNDSMFGQDGNDTIDGGIGNDWIQGGFGTDSLSGGLGNDTLYGDGGDDVLEGGDGVDVLSGSDGNDTLYGEGDGDWLQGGTGMDLLLGGLGNDTLYGDGDDDRLEGGDGVDVLSGGDGNDTLYGEGDGDLLQGGTGMDLLLGGLGNDTLYGNGDDDRLEGGDGVDVLVGETGNDTLIGGAGNDRLLAGDGADSIDGGTGNDTVDAGSGDDTVYGWTGDDNLTGGDGNDSMFGQDGNDTLDGGIGNDYLDGDDGVAGADSISGGDGADTLVGDGGNDTLLGGTGNDSIFAGADDDSVEGGDGNDQIFGESGADLIEADAGDDTVLGGDGNDTIFGFEGNDSVLGGAGDDVINTRTSPGTGLPDEGYGAIGNPLYYPDDPDAFNDRDTVDGGIGNDSILTGDDNDLIIGGDGADTVDAGFDDDSVSGGDGIDSLEGNEGNDTISGGADGDVIYGDVSTTNANYPLYAPYELPNDGTDLAPNNNADLLSGDGGNDTIYGQDDNDTLYGGDGNDILDGGIDNDLLDGEAGSDTLFGGSGDDTLFGGADTSADSLVGGDGNDSLNGGGGNDQVEGGTGNDWLSGNSGNDTVRGGDGADSVFGAEGDDVMTGDAGNDSMEGWTGNDSMYGGTGDDYIDGASGADLLEGGDGNDTLLGGSDIGNDTLRGGVGDDSLSAGGGDDLLEGGEGADVLFAADGNDQLDGGDGNDTLDGWTGNDTINAGGGNDSIIGGDGDDTFVYVAGDGVDTINDFNFGNSGTLIDGDITNNDRIDLSSFYDNIWELTADQADDGILNQSNDGVDGVDYSNNTSFAGGGLVFTGAVADTSYFNVENTGVVCFASGTRILTEHGERPVESLCAGDRIVTRDNGIQTLRWVGHRTLGAQELFTSPKLRPVLLKPELTGGDAPLIVSPQHGVLLNLEGEETLVRATHLAQMQGGAARVMNGCKHVTYFHIMFDDHQIVFANGAPSESFFPGQFALGAMHAEARREVFDLFPDLQYCNAETAYGSKARVFARSKHLPNHLRVLKPRPHHRSVASLSLPKHPGGVKPGGQRFAS